MKALSLNLTRPLLAWLRQDPQWASLDWRTRATLHWRAGWGSLNLRQSQALLEPQHTPIEPLLILGPWRSGTTAMHELLSKALGWPTPLNWQCMNASTFTIGASPSAGRTVARPMDGLAVNALTPQEDEFALLTLGAPSAYQAFWMPHRLPELKHTLDQGFWLGSSDWLDLWDYFLRGVLTPQHGGKILLKSPNHTFRLQAILKRYPGAKVVWMLRDPLEVYTSNVKMWQLMFQEHGLTSFDTAALDRFLTTALLASADALRWALDRLPAGHLVCCAQPALRDAPDEVLAQVLSELGLADAPPGSGSGRLWPVSMSAPGSGPKDPELVAALEALRQAQAEATERRG